MTTRDANKPLVFLASTPVTIGLLVLAMVLVVWGTLAQVNIGPFEAQRQYFNSFWVTTGGKFRIPIFPGGVTVGILWAIGLSAAFISRFQYGWKDLGITITHAGLIVLLLGQFFSQTLSREQRLAIEVGQTKNYAENDRDIELSFVLTSDPKGDQVVAVPGSRLATGSVLTIPSLPFSVVVKKFFPNARLMGLPVGMDPMATQGLGAQMMAEELPRALKDDEFNNTTAIIELLEGPVSLGTWLVAAEMEAPQMLTLKDKTYQVSLRARRQYFPYSLTLKEFRHDVYPGTNIPKNFASVIHLDHPAAREERDVIISMNHPFRYEGLTFYQASYGKNDTLSVLQVVRNPVWLSPYIATVIICLGLAFQFMLSLLVYLRKKS